MDNYKILQHSFSLSWGIHHMDKCLTDKSILLRFCPCCCCTLHIRMCLVDYCIFFLYPASMSFFFILSSVLTLRSDIFLCGISENRKTTFGLKHLCFAASYPIQFEFEFEFLKQSTSNCIHIIKFKEGEGFIVLKPKFSLLSFFSRRICRQQ